jgi:hypothetical protein
MSSSFPTCCRPWTMRSALVSGPIGVFTVRGMCWSLVTRERTKRHVSRQERIIATRDRGCGVPPCMKIRGKRWGKSGRPSPARRLIEVSSEHGNISYHCRSASKLSVLMAESSCVADGSVCCRCQEVLIDDVTSSRGKTAQDPFYSPSLTRYVWPNFES